jgi:VWFA-related protein
MASASCSTAEPRWATMILRADPQLARHSTVLLGMTYLRAVTLPLLALGLSTLPSVPAQTPDAIPKADISVEAKLIVVPTVVRDKHGVLMNTLTKDDFVLEVDGKPQPIRYFDHDSDVPLTLGLLVDTSMSQRSVLDDERTASATFLEKMLAPNRDKAFLIDFARTVTLLQDITDSRPKLQQALQQLDSSRPSFQRPGDSTDNSSTGGHFGGGTTLYDSVFLAADEVMSKVKGRRALILLTDGDDRGSKVSLARAIEAAQHADTTVYAIYYKGEHQDFRGGPGGGHHGGYGGGHPFASQNDFAGGQMGHGGYGHEEHIDGKKILERICGETGGRVFEVTKKETVDAIYAQIGEELRAQYRLGFSPSTDAAAEGYHKVLLTLTATHAKEKPVIQTRDGYYMSAAKQP